jgi:hypothetical protein
MTTDGKERNQPKGGFPKKREIFEKFFEHEVHSPGGIVQSSTISATGMLKQIKGHRALKLMQYLRSEGVFIKVKRFETISHIGCIHKLSPTFTYRPSYEAALRRKSSRHGRQKKKKKKKKKKMTPIRMCQS